MLCSIPVPLIHSPGHTLARYKLNTVPLSALELFNGPMEILLSPEWLGLQPLRLLWPVLRSPLPVTFSAPSGGLIPPPCQSFLSEMASKAPPQVPSCCRPSLSPPYFAYDTLESPSLKAFMRYTDCYMLYRRQHSCVNHKPGWWKPRDKSHCGRSLLTGSSSLSGVGTA